MDISGQFTGNTKLAKSQYLSHFGSGYLYSAATYDDFDNYGQGLSFANTSNNQMNCEPISKKESILAVIVKRLVRIY